MTTRNAENRAKHWIIRFLIWNAADVTCGVTNWVTIYSQDSIVFHTKHSVQIFFLNIFINIKYEKKIGFKLEGNTLYFLVKMWVTIKNLKNVCCSVIYHLKVYPIFFKRPVVFKLLQMQFRSTYITIATPYIKWIHLLMVFFFLSVLLFFFLFKWKKKISVAEFSFLFNFSTNVI